MVWEQAVVLIGKHEHLLMVVGSILGCDLTKVCSLLQEIQSRMHLPMVVMAVDYSFVVVLQLEDCRKDIVRVLPSSAFAVVSAY